MEGSEGAAGRLGAGGRLGAKGSSGAGGQARGRRQGRGWGTDAVTPLLLDAVTDPPRAGEVRLPPPDALRGWESKAPRACWTHCVPEGSACGTGSEPRLGSEVRALAVWVAPLRNVLAAHGGNAAIPAAPAVSRMISADSVACFPFGVARSIGRRRDRGENGRTLRSSGRASFRSTTSGRRRLWRLRGHPARTPSGDRREPVANSGRRLRGSSRRSKGGGAVSQPAADARPPRADD